MTPLELYRHAADLGFRLEAAGDKLAVYPGEGCPAELVAELRANKGELLDWLSRPPIPGWGTVPPTDLPLCPDRPRPTQQDARLIMSYVVRQLGGDIGRGTLCHWLCEHEASYWTRFGWRDEVCAYCSARDAAAFQLNRTEAEVWETLAAFEESAAGHPKQTGPGLPQDAPERRGP